MPATAGCTVTPAVSGIVLQIILVSICLQVSPADQDVIVREHNMYRAAANPPASDMRLMRWDEEVAMIAQKWADNCVFKHDGARWIPGRFGVGQNLALGYASWPQAVKGWHDEYKHFTYGSSSNSFQQTGHYTAMMWANTSLVGCGYRNCKKTGKMYVCNYAPEGNLLHALNIPYKRGRPCSECPDRCVNGSFCDCGKTCLNYAVLNFTTCECSCVMNNQFYDHQGVCDLNCTGPGKSKLQPFFCRTKDQCPTYGRYCPIMCNFCPYAGKGYSGPGPHSGEAPRDSVNLHAAVLVLLTLLALPRLV